MESVEVAECNSFEHLQAPPDCAAFIRSITDNKVTKLRVIDETTIGSHYEDDFFIPNSQRKHAMIRFGKSMTGTGWHIKLVNGHYLYINGVFTRHKKWLLLKEDTTIGITKHNSTSILIEFENVNRSSTSLLASEESAISTTLPKGGVSDIPSRNSSLAISNMSLDRSPEEATNDPSEVQNVHPKIKVRAILPPPEFHGFIQSMANGSKVNLRRSFDTTIGSDKIDTYCVQQAKEEHAKIRFGQSPLGIGWHIRLKNGKSFYLNNNLIEHQEWRLLPEFNVISITGDAATAFSVELANEIRSPASSNANPRKRPSTDEITFHTPTGFSSLGSGFNEDDHYTPLENTCLPSSSFTPKRPKLSVYSLQPLNNCQTKGKSILLPRSSSSPKVNKSVKSNKKTSTVPKYQQSKIDNFFAPVKTKGNSGKMRSNDSTETICVNPKIAHNEVIYLDGTEADFNYKKRVQTSTHFENDSQPNIKSTTNNNRSSEKLKVKSSSIKLSNRLSDLNSYLEKYSASPQFINQLNTNQYRYSVAAIKCMAKSKDDPSYCITLPEEDAASSENRRPCLYNKLVRLRFEKELTSILNRRRLHEETYPISECKQKSDCFNLYHSKYMNSAYYRSLMEENDHYMALDTITSDMEDEEVLMCEPVLSNKLVKLQPYLDVCGIKGDMISLLNKSLNTMAPDFIENVSKSTNDPDCCILNNKPFPKRYQSSHSKLCEKELQLNRLVRARYGIGLSSGHQNDIAIAPTCKSKDQCVNLFHRSYVAPTVRYPPRTIGGYTFVFKTVTGGAKLSSKKCISVLYNRLKHRLIFLHTTKFNKNYSTRSPIESKNFQRENDSDLLKPVALKVLLKEWKNVFEFSEMQNTHYLYFFTRKGSKDVLYYGISADPKMRWAKHKKDPKSAMYDFFNNGEDLVMHISPLGDINIMLAGELEATLIALSQMGSLKDGNCAVNATGGSFLSNYALTETTVASKTGQNFRRLVLAMNELIDVTLASKNVITN